MIVAGFGFRASASAESLLDALEQVVDGTRPTHLSAPDDKVDAECLRAVSERLQLPVVSVGSAALTEAETMTQSPRVIEERGVGSVAEAVALAAVGEGARLAGPRAVSADRLATCAIAIGGAA